MTAPVTWQPSAREALERAKTRLFATSTEAALILNIDSRTLRSAIERGDIPGTRAGSAWRVPVSWLLAQARLDIAGSSDRG